MAEQPSEIEAQGSKVAVTEIEVDLVAATRFLAKLGFIAIPGIAIAAIGFRALWWMAVIALMGGLFPVLFLLFLIAAAVGTWLKLRRPRQVALPGRRRVLALKLTTKLLPNEDF